MKCAICGKEFLGNPNTKRKQKYCSPACRQKAYELRKRIGAKPVKVGTRTPKAVMAGEFDADIPLDPVAFSRRMERETDRSLEDTLRHNITRLQAAVDDPATPAPSLAKLAETVVSLTEKLEALTGATGRAAVDLLAEDEENEVVEDDIGAQII